MHSLAMPNEYGKAPRLQIDVASCFTSSACSPYHARPSALRRFAVYGPLGKPSKVDDQLPIQPMHKIALVVTIEFKPESKASFLQSLLDHKQRCLASEPGTLQFEVLAPTESAQSVVLFELYASAEALVAHDAGGSLALFIEQAGPLITKVSRQHCSVLSP